MTTLAHKILLQPRPLQAEWLIEQCGYERWCYNRMLAKFKQGLDNGIWWDCDALAYDLRRNRPEWASERWANAISMARLRLYRAIKNWLNPNMNNGFPKFHKRKVSMSCAFPQEVIRLDGCKIRLPKLGWVRMRHALRFDGKLVGNATISYDGRRWCVSLRVDTQTAPHPKTGDCVIGVDVGIKTMAVTSNGVEHANPRALEAVLPEIRAVNKAIARSINTHGKNRAE